MNSSQFEIGELYEEGGTKGEWYIWLHIYPEPHIPIETVTLALNLEALDLLIAKLHKAKKRLLEEILEKDEK